MYLAITGLMTIHLFQHPRWPWRVLIWIFTALQTSYNNHRLVLHLRSLLFPCCMELQWTWAPQEFACFCAVGELQLTWESASEGHKTTPFLLSLRIWFVVPTFSASVLPPWNGAASYTSSCHVMSCHVMSRLEWTYFWSSRTEQSRKSALHSCFITSALASASRWSICSSRNNLTSFSDSESLVWASFSPWIDWKRQGNTVSVGMRFLTQLSFVWERSCRSPRTCSETRWTWHRVFSEGVINSRSVCTCSSLL